MNGIESLSNQAKRALRNNGIDRKAFPLFLKEYEFGFNTVHKEGSWKLCNIGARSRVLLIQPRTFNSRRPDRLSISPDLWGALAEPSMWSYSVGETALTLWQTGNGVATARRRRAS
jgi:hypothetical protein